MRAWATCVLALACGAAAVRAAAAGPGGVIYTCRDDQGMSFLLWEPAPGY